MRQPVSRDGLVPLLKSLAQSNGLRVTETREFLRLDAITAAGAPLGDSAIAPSAEVRLVVYRLKHAKASQLANTLQSIFGSGRGIAQSGLREAPLSQTLRDDYLPPAVLDPGEPVNREPKVDVELGKQRALIPGELHGEIQIVPDENTNALIVRAQPGDWDVLKQTIEQLDIRPLQVLIEVVIAEVRRSREWDLSVSGKAPDRVAPEVSGSLKGNTDGDFVFRLLRAGHLDVTAALSVLSSRGEVRILSRPVVFAQNNQEARILIGSERPFIQASRSLPTDAGVRDEVIQYRDVGTKLTLVPTINDDGYVNLQVLQEVSTATSEIQFGAPIISTREASTHLFVKDGQMAILGGLIDRQQEKTRSGIPLLMEIPLIGGLFGSTHSTTSNSELFLFLTPHIVATDEDLDENRERMGRQTPLITPTLPRDSSTLNSERP
jgi:general secretion pathway protein D